MRYKKLKLRFAAILVATLSLGLGMKTYALQKIDVIPAAYDTGAPAKTLANNTGVSMTANKQVGYTLVFSDSPSLMSIKLGSSANSQATLEIRLDDAATGTLLGTVVTEPTSGWSTKDYELKLKAPMKGKHTIYVKSKKGTCDFQAMTFLINEAADRYPSLSADTGFYNAEDAKMQSKLNLMYQLGILDNEIEYKGDELITRREYIKVTDKLYPDLNAAPDEYMFEDISRDDRDYKAISNLYARKIIKGTTSGKLVPDKFITAEEMLKMSLRAMGYSYMEEYGENTFRTADKADILSDFTVSGQTVRRDDMVNLIYNMLTGKVMKASVIGQGAGEYRSEKEGVLSITKDIYFDIDIVSDNGFTNIYDVDSCVKKGEVKIGGRVCNVNGKDAADYIGMRCLYFYTEGSADSFVLEAIAPYVRTEYAVFSTKDTDFKEIKERYISYYDEKDKKKTIDFSSSTCLVFNGKAIDRQLTELIPDISKFLGKVVAIDNDSDNVYDVALIESYVSVIFGGVSDGELYDKLNNTRLPVYDTDEALIYVDGTRISWTDVPENAVMDVYQSANITGEIAERFIVNTSSEEGTADTKTDDGLYIGGTEYDVYYGFTDMPALGQNYTVYFNSDGQIVRMVKDADGFKLGYLYSVSPAKNDSGKNSCLVKILSEENKVEKLFFAENVTIDGVRIKGIDELMRGKAPFSGAENIASEKPVLYMTNADGLITYLDTVKTLTDNDLDNLRESLQEGAYNNKSIGFAENGKSLLVCAFAADKKVITLWNTGEKELATIGTSFTAGSSQNITASAYTTKKDSILSDIILWKNSTVGNHKTDFVFKTLAKGLNEDGDAVTVLRGVAGAENVEYPVNSYIMSTAAEGEITYEKLIASLEPGDLISVGVNARGEAEVIKPILFKNGEPTNSIGATATISKTTATDTNYSRGVTSHGKVLGVEKGMIKFEKDVGGVKTVEYASCTQARIIKVEEVNSKVTITNNLGINNIMVGDHIVVVRNTGSYSAAEVFLYETIDW